MRNMNALVFRDGWRVDRPIAGSPRAAAGHGLARSVTAARLAIASSLATLALLGSLHVLSPELEPSWRMVSEYAFGHYGWVLSFMFLAWGISSWALTAALWQHIPTRRGRIGLSFLVLAGVGEALAAAFDITHDLGHNLAGVLGIGGLPVAAVLVSASLDRVAGWGKAARLRRGLAYLACASPLLLIATVVLMAVQFAQIFGGQLPDHAPATLPAGVMGLDGWADRLLVVSFCLWQSVVGWQAIGVAHASSQAAS